MLAGTWTSDWPPAKDWVREPRTSADVKAAVKTGVEIGFLPPAFEQYVIGYKLSCEIVEYPILIKTWTQQVLAEG